MKLCEYGSNLVIAGKLHTHSKQTSILETLTKRMVYWSSGNLLFKVLPDAINSLFFDCRGLVQCKPLSNRATYTIVESRLLKWPQK